MSSYSLQPASSPCAGRRGRALLALLLLVPVPSLATAASMFWWPGTAWGQGLFLGGKLWILLLPVAWLIWVEKGRLSWSPPRKGGFGVGALLGLGIGAAIVVVFFLALRLGWIKPAEVAERAATTGLNQPRLYLLGAVYWITANSLMEEYVWRWFVFRQGELLVGSSGAVAVSAVGFTAHHVVALAGQFSWPITMLGSLGVCTGGAVWSWLYLRYRSIWPGYLSHALVDLPIFVIGGWLIFGSAAG